MRQAALITGLKGFGEGLGLGAVAASAPDYNG